MPRLPGGSARDLPSCPRPGHLDCRVVRDGRYGTPPRQRFRCVGPDGFHRFVPELPRHAAHEDVCDACDSRVPTHRGPVTGRKYDFPLREVADALVAVGGGASYQQAALRARARSGRPLLEGDWGGSVVAEWLDTLAPVVLTAHAETAWPETLVLDSTRFMTRNSWTGTPQLAFSVLGAYGYPASGAGRPRVWALAAYHQATQVEWVDFLRTLDVSTPPRMVISDGAVEVANAVREVWPEHPSPSFPLPFVYRCDYHLRQNAREAMADDGIDHWGSVRMNTLNDAFRSYEGWQQFSASIWPKHRAAHTWVTANADRVATQAALRAFLPHHYSTAALDAQLGRVRDFLDSRSFVLRNARRTTTTLGLVRLHLNGLDNARRYSELLRAWLDEHGGFAPPQRASYDTGTGGRTPAGQRQPASLRR